MPTATRRAARRRGRAVHSRTSVIRPDVSVRVLSVQTTVADPSASTAGSRRTSAWRRAIRCTPTASAIVATAGSASGTAATASAMPISTTSPSGAPCQAPRAATSAAMPSASHTRRRPSSSRRRSSGVRPSSIVPTSVPMRPISVDAPVSVTTASAVPADRRRALVDHVRAIGERRSFFELLVGALRHGSDSPVSAASSVRKSVASISRASAGTRRPMSSWMMSPGTIVAASTLRSCPDRMTVAFDDVELQKRFHRAARPELGRRIR